MEFIRRFLQHVLPTGFMKVRYYGFMNPNCKLTLDHISSLIETTCGFDDYPKLLSNPLGPSPVQAVAVCLNCAP